MQNLYIFHFVSEFSHLFLPLYFSLPRFVPFLVSSVHFVVLVYACTCVCVCLLFDACAVGVQVIWILKICQTLCTMNGINAIASMLDHMIHYRIRKIALNWNRYLCGSDYRRPSLPKWPTKCTKNSLYVQINR